ncbi:ATP-binding protein [Streptomyces sp. NPDC052107]|uniref:ATP-binding protein n=1 Tax=Streptomyces sp. NPDC052107 TaxID=3155632 RepID=UPI003447C180
MDVGAVLIAITGVMGTLGGALLAQRGADRAKKRELEMVQAIQEARENRELRRSCYTQPHREVRQFATALSRHLYVIQDRTPGQEDVSALEGTKDAYRDRWSAALMIAPDTVIVPAPEMNAALTEVYGQIKRLEQETPGRTKPCSQPLKRSMRSGSLIRVTREAEGEEKSSIAIASNEAFSGWSRTFTDPRLCAAIVDRLTSNATLIETGTESYRLARSKARVKQKSGQ